MAEASGRGSLRAGERRHSPFIRQRRQKVMPARRCGKSQLSIAREGFLDRRSKRLSFPHFFLRRKKCGRRRPPPRQGKTNSPPQRRKRAFFVSDGDNFAPRRELLLSAVTKVAKSTGRNCVSALPQRATPVRCRPRFPSRNRRFPDRCRSPDCACTAFRCRCLLLW